jgi:hypothetical protein
MVALMAGRSKEPGRFLAAMNSWKPAGSLAVDG